MPADHPEIRRGAPVYCSSSQAVKQKYRYHRPKPGAYVVRTPMMIEAKLTTQALTVVARAGDVEVSHLIEGPFAPVQDLERMQEAMHATFARLGQSRLTLESLSFVNEAKGFVPLSKLNQLRRDVVKDLEAALEM